MADIENDWLSKDDYDYEPPPFELRTHEETEAVRSLEMVGELLPRVGDDVYMWKWVILALQNATQAYMVLALRGTSPVRLFDAGAMKRSLKAFEAGDWAQAFKWQRMADFLTIYKRLQSNDAMGMFIQSRAFEPTGSVTRSMSRLVSIRNVFVHFMPSTLVDDVLDLPQVVLDASEIIDFVMFRSGNVIQLEEDDLFERTKRSLDGIRQNALQLAANYLAMAQASNES